MRSITVQRSVALNLGFALAFALTPLIQASQAKENAASVDVSVGQPLLQMAIQDGTVAREPSRHALSQQDLLSMPDGEAKTPVAVTPLPVLDRELLRATENESPLELTRVIVFLDYLPHREMAERAKTRYRDELDAVETGVAEIVGRSAAQRDTAAASDSMNYSTMYAMSSADRQRLHDLKLQYEAITNRMKTAANAEIKVAVSASQVPVIAEFERLGGTFEYAATTANLVVGQLPVGSIRELSELPGVLRVAGDRLAHGSLNIAADATQVRSTNAGGGLWDNGYTGDIWDPGIIDSGVDLTHPGMQDNATRTNFWTWYLVAAMSDAAFNETCCDEDDYNGHGMHVAGIVGSYGTSFYPTLLGMSPGVEKLVHLKSGWDNAFTGGTSMFWSDKYHVVDRVLYDNNVLMPNNTFLDDIETLNLSYGGDTTSDDTDAGRFWDSAIATFSDLVVTIAAGNSGPTNTLFTDPASAYNPIAVANVDDRNTVTRDDDIIRASSTRGPTASGRRKPDIAAPGTSISSANTFWETQLDYVDKGGTSMAAPMVSGVAIDLMDAGLFDETRIKALLINTAQKNEPGINFENDADGWSEAFGWGYMNAWAAYFHRTDTRLASLAPRDTDGSSDADYVLYRVDMRDEGAGAEGRDRATMVWNREAVYNTAAPPTTFYSNADMDLRLYQEDNGAFLDVDSAILDNVHQVRVPAGYAAQDTIVKAYSFSTSFSHGGTTQVVALAMEENPQLVTMAKPGGDMPAGGSWPISVEPNEEFAVTFGVTNTGDVATHSNTLTPDLTAGYTIVSGPATANVGSIAGGGGFANFTWVLRAPPTAGAVNQLAFFHGHTSYGEFPDDSRWALLQSVEFDITAPLPDPMCFSNAPFGSGLNSMSMTACFASDLHAPVEYFLFWTGTPTGGPGLTDSGWQLGRSYTDDGLGPNHNYCYVTFARDAAIGQNQTAASTPTDCGWTWIEPSSGVDFGLVTTTSIEAASVNTPDGLNRGTSGLFVQNLTAGFSTGWKQNNTPWTLSGLNVNTPYTYVVKARNGESVLAPDSPLGTVFTRANPPAAAPFGSISDTSIEALLNPNGNPPGTQYLFQNVTAGSNSGWNTATNWNSTGLVCETNYTFQVRARNGDGVQTVIIPLGVVSTGGCLIDTDSDGVPDSADNCTLAPNPSQFDADGDGFGMPCDADFDNSCLIDFVDLGMFKANFFGTNPLYNLDEAGIIDFVDLGIVKSLFFGAPGPSGVPNICP